MHESKRNGGRLRKTTIVALARKLLVALWKYVTAGVVIEGAIVKRALKAFRTDCSNLPRPDQSRRIRVDESKSGMAWKAEFKNGLVLLSLARRKRDCGAVA